MAALLRVGGCSLAGRYIRGFEPAQSITCVYKQFFMFTFRGLYARALLSHTSGMRALWLTILGLAISASTVAWAQPALTFRDCPTCPEMVVLPAGSFVMGAPASEEEDAPEEFRGWSVPQVPVTFRQPFSMGRFEVTRGEFRAFVEASGYMPVSSCRVLTAGGIWADRHGASWDKPGFEQTDEDPVICVSAEDALAYTRWLSQLTGRRYRLPSESEWEYGARAGSPEQRYWGDASPCAFANVADASLAAESDATRMVERYFACVDGYPRSAPVGSFAANAFGLHDMLGNVWEWTGDCWKEDLVGVPRDGAYRPIQDNPFSCIRRAARGGGWSSPPALIRAAQRFGAVTRSASINTGFRVAREGGVD
ncbi:MAG: formylglycine-generating enzyme family protein [Alphaproteobacteria bacterium]|nr:formylglycine-generating enzyme family protein [Alphaproteobacteria bacterium]